MRIEQVTAQIIRDVEQFNSAFNSARFGTLQKLPGNPFCVEVRKFGHALAVKNNSPQLRGKQRVSGFKAADAEHLDGLLRWYRADGLRCAIQVDYGEMNLELFRRFVAAGLFSRGSAGAHAWMEAIEQKPLPKGLVVSESGEEERELYLDLFQKCFVNRGEAKPEYRPIQWAEDGLAGGKRFIAEWEGRTVGFGSMPIVDGVAICGTAGTLPEFRGRGVQRCLIERRIAEAARLGCSMMMGGAELESVAHRNFVRCGFRMLPLGMSWVDTGN